MSVFPVTSLTLMKKIAAEIPGEDEAAWVRFYNLYTPAIRRFVEWNDRTQDPDDVVQDVFVKLVDILRSGKFDPHKARFRAFLTTIIRRQLISMYRKDCARGGEGNLPLENFSDVLSVPAEQGTELDRSWARAKHAAAVEHVLTKTALSPQSKAVYKAYVLEERPIDEVVKAFGMTKNNIAKIKFRVDNMISVIVEELTEEKPSGVEFSHGACESSDEGA